MFKHSLATVAVAAGLLAAAGPASAGTHHPGLIGYNGHAGLGANAAGVQDGTSNTVMFGARAGRADFILMADPGGQFARTALRRSPAQPTRTATARDVPAANG